MKSKLLTSIVAAATLAVGAAKGADIKGNIEYNVSEKSENNMAELNLCYKPPGGINGFTFLDFKKDGSYFGKSYLDRKVAGPVDASVRLSHAGEPLSKVEVGASVRIPINKYGEMIGLKNTFLTGTTYLAGFDTTDSLAHVEDSLVLRAKAGTTLPGDVKVFAFGEVNPNTGRIGYGELDVSKSFDVPGIGGVEVAYNPNWIEGADGSMNYSHRAAFRKLF